MDFAILTPEVLGDPEQRGYANMDAVEVAADMNTEYCTRVEALTMGQLREWAATGTRAINIYKAIDNEALSDEVRNICIVADRLMGTDDGSLEPGNPDHVALITGLQQAGILSAADVAALIAKATKTMSRAAYLKLPYVWPGHVQEARRFM